MKNTHVFTVQDAYELFDLDCRSRRLTRSTQSFYRNKIAVFMRWLGDQGITSLVDVTSIHIKTFLLSLDERGLKANSQHDYARSMKTFFNYCVRDELLSESPFRRVKMPRTEDVLPVILTDDEIKTVLDRIKDTRNRLIFKFIMDSGVRASELVALNVGDVDLATGVVTVRQGKGRTDRLTSIGARTRKDAKRLLLQRKNTNDNSALFVSHHSGQRLALVGLMHIFRKMQIETGIGHLTAHTVRRTMATRSLRGGMDAYVLSRMLGHSDLQVLRKYARIDAELVQRAADGHSVVDNL